MMSKLTALSLALILLLTAFPLISLGTTSDASWLWWLGLAALILGGLIPPIRRFATRNTPKQPPSRVGLPEDDRTS